MKSLKIWFFYRTRAIRFWRDSQRRKIAQAVNHVRYRAPLWILDLARRIVQHFDRSGGRRRRLEILELTRELWATRLGHTYNCHCGSSLRSTITRDHGGTRRRVDHCFRCGNTNVTYSVEVDF
jgi:hypothetical protein